MTLSQPAHVFLEVHMECNLRCVQCDIYALRNPVDELSEAERRGVIRQVADWHNEIRVVIGGGEAFARKSMLYAVGEEARTLGVYMTVSTNGTLLRDQDFERLPGSGIRCVVVSIDSDEPDVHDRIRGVPGTFERATRTIRALVAARDRAREDFTVLTSSILGSHNLHRVESLVTFLEELGVDTTLYQPIQPAFARTVATEWWKVDALFPRDASEVKSGIAALMRLRATGHRIFQTLEQLDDARRYLMDPSHSVPGQCASMDKHLMVDMRGDVRLCFNMERIGLHPVGNVRENALRDIWHDTTVERVRQRMRGCSESCGSMLCHAR
jgi:MoaA/NifB/PqqE/SkfB family radical SAM enzyme